MKQIRHGYFGLMRVIDPVSRALLPPRRKSPTRQQPGAPPGLEAGFVDVHTPPERGQVVGVIHDYGPESMNVLRFDGADPELPGRKPDDVAVRWIDIEGLHPNVVARETEALGIHTLAAEDALHRPQRPRFEAFDGYVHVVARMMRVDGDVVVAEQVSLFLFPDLVLTFQEQEKDVWTLVRRRLETGTRIRQRGADYLAYALLDAIVDHYFEVLDHYGAAIEALETELMDDPRAHVVTRIQALRRELGSLRRAIFPLRNALESFAANEVVPLTKLTRTYLRNVTGHAAHVLDLLESHWETATALIELQASLQANRMNEVMKVLTVVSSMFIPLTFLAGVYGMNFEHIPELGWRWAYPAFWAVALAVLVTLLVMFRRLGWLGGGDGARHRGAAPPPERP